MEDADEVIEVTDLRRAAISEGIVLGDGSGEALPEFDRTKLEGTAEVSFDMNPEGDSAGLKLLFRPDLAAQQQRIEVEAQGLEIVAESDDVAPGARERAASAAAALRWALDPSAEHPMATILRKHRRPDEGRPGGGRTLESP